MRRDVGELRQVGEDQRLVGQQARGHQRQRRVLGAADRDLALSGWPPRMRILSMGKRSTTARRLRRLRR